MASFQAKKNRERPRNSENKNYRSDQFLPNLKQNIPKKQQKNSKNYKTPLRLFFKPKQLGKGREIEKIKIIVPINFYRTRNRNFQRNCKKNQKIIKHPQGFTSSQNRLGKAEKEKKLKLSFRSIIT